MGINEGLNYVKSDWKKLFYSLWSLLPIIGWWALLGYNLDVINSLRKKEKGLPKLNFKKSFGEGFMYSIHLLGFFIVTSVLSYVLGYIPIIGAYLSWLIGFLISLVIGLLTVHYAEERKFKNLLDYKKAIDLIKKDFIGLIVLYLKIIVTAIIGLFVVTISAIGVILPIIVSFGLGVIIQNFYVEYYNQ